MTQQYMTPQRPKRPASRLVAGLLWLAAAGLAVGATFANIMIYSFGGGESLFVVGFWRQYGLTVEGENSPGTIYYGASEVAGAAFLLLATLLVFLSARRWAAVIAGAFGTGMLVTAVLTWFLTALSTQANTTIIVESGLWILAGATGAALLAFLVSLFERTQPAEQPQPQYVAPPPPPLTPPTPAPLPPRIWEPETPKYGIAVEEAPPVSKPVAVAHEEDVFDAFDAPEFQNAMDRPRAPEAGSISRKLDGDEK
ncbi:MAG: hypothetical protein ABW224_21690 [Kibdelosporangium sp.]